MVECDVEGLKFFFGVPFVESECEVESEDCCQDVEPNCDVVWVEPFIDFAVCEGLELLEILGGDDEAALLSQLNQFFCDVCQIRSGEKMFDVPFP